MNVRAASDRQRMMDKPHLLCGPDQFSGYPDLGFVYDLVIEAFFTIIVNGGGQYAKGSYVQYGTLIPVLKVSDRFGRICGQDENGQLAVTFFYLYGQRIGIHRFADEKYLRGADHKNHKNKKYKNQNGFLHGYTPFCLYYSEKKLELQEMGK